MAGKLLCAELHAEGGCRLTVDGDAVALGSESAKENHHHQDGPRQASVARTFLGKLTPSPAEIRCEG
jgi:hypothetical protein